jgi:hypothetical protein
MKFDESVPAADRRRIVEALADIKTYGNARQRLTAEFVERTEITIRLGPAARVGGSGSVRLGQVVAAHWAVARGVVSIERAAGFVRLDIARETIDTGGQQGIEGTFVHEGKHALDFAHMISDFSNGSGDAARHFDPTGYQREYSAHLTSAFYLMRRGGAYTAEGVGLGILYAAGGDVSVSRKGIRARLKNNYGLTPERPGKRLSQLCFPPLVPRGSWLWGMI